MLLKSLCIPLVESILRIQHGEHPLVELGEELPEGLLEVDPALLVVGLQILEEVGEHVRVALVENAVGLLEHQVEVVLRVLKQVREKTLIIFFYIYYELGFIEGSKFNTI